MNGICIYEISISILNPLPTFLVSYYTPIPLLLLLSFSTPLTTVPSSPPSMPVIILQMCTV